MTDFSEYERDAEARASDLALLRELIDVAALSDEESEVFADMLARMERQHARLVKLSDKQRARAEAVARRNNIDFTDRHPIRAEDVPRGREVETPEILSKESLRRASRREEKVVFPYREPSRALAKHAPRASLWRRFVWWFHGGPRRLLLARARREAIFGDPTNAIVMIAGVHEGARTILMFVEKVPDPVMRLECERRFVCDYARGRIKS